MAMHTADDAFGPGVPGRPRRRGRLGLLAAVLALTGLLGAACSTAPEARSGQRSGVGQRVLTVELTGGTTYANSGIVESGAVRVAYDSGSGVTSLKGTVGIPGLAGGTASVAFNLAESLGKYSGTVSVNDPAAGVARSVTHNLVPLAFDNDGDSSGAATSGGVTLAWSLGTVPATGLEPELDALSAAESTFCQEAQRDLVGLDESTLPAASIGNTVHSSRAAFGGSKAVFSPLAVQTWSEVDMATTTAGNTVALSHRISCKTRSSDHLATAGYPTAPDAACSTLTERSLELAREKMTPAQRTAYDTTGTQLSLRPDRNESTGNDYLTPIVDEVDNGTTLEVTAHALKVDWTDPAYQLLPDTIRGVHYCTVWAPAWAYWWMTEGAF